MNYKFSILLFAAVFLFACNDYSTKPAPVEKQEEPAEPTRKIFRWTDEMCAFEGIYDPSKYHLKQLSDTYYLWFSSRSEISELDATLFRNPKKLYYGLNEDELKGLDERYNTLKEKIENLWLPDEEPWQSLRQKKLKKLKETYEIYRLKAKALNDPEVLHDGAYGHECEEYIEALNNYGDDLMDTWEGIVREHMKNNADPELLYNRYYQERMSADSQYYARTYVLTFGWHNCVYHNLDNSDFDEDYRDDFDKLFISITQGDCDEP